MNASRPSAPKGDATGDIHSYFPAKPMKKVNAPCAKRTVKGDLEFMKGQDYEDGTGRSKL